MQDYAEVDVGLVVEGFSYENVNSYILSDDNIKSSNIISFNGT